MCTAAPSSLVCFSKLLLSFFRWVKVLEARKRQILVSYRRMRVFFLAGGLRVLEGWEESERLKGQSEKTDLVFRGSCMERCAGHYAECWYREELRRLCGPAQLSIPAPGSLSSAPTLCSLHHVLDTPSPHSLTAQSSGFHRERVSGGGNFSFWSVFIFSQQSILWRTDAWQGEQKKKNFYRGCETWTI